MKLNKFQVEQLSTSELQNVMGGKDSQVFEGTRTHTGSRNTMSSSRDVDCDQEILTLTSVKREIPLLI